MRSQRRTVATVAVTAACVLMLPGAGGIPSATASGPVPAGPTGLRLSTPVLSVRRLPDFLARTVARQRAQKGIEDVWAAGALGPAGATSCIEVDQGAAVVVQANVETPLLPASNLKLLSATAALDKLGPDARFTTVVKARHSPSGGVVAGDLYLVGGGDPLLRTPGYAAGLPYPEPTFTSLVQLAARVRAAGVRHVTGSVVGDESRYDAQRTIPSWKPAYTLEGDVGPLSALQVNDGFERVSPPPSPPSRSPSTRPPTTRPPNPRTTPTTAPRSTVPTTTTTTTLPRVTTPPTTTRPGASSPSASRAQPAAGSPDGAPSPSIQVPAPQPAIQAAQVFAGLLAADGIQIDGGQLVGVTPTSATVLSSVDSAPLSQVLGVILRSSDDTGSELLTKELGYRFAGAGTTAAGLGVIRADLAADGLPLAGYAAVDGSGLDRSDRVTCALVIADLRRWGVTGPLAAELPAAGRSGTLIHRLAAPVTAGRILAKTGSLEEVSALSGFVTVPGGSPAAGTNSPLTFSVVLNGVSSQSAAEHIEDQVAAVLARFPDAPPRASLSPAAAAPA